MLTEAEILARVTEVVRETLDNDAIHLAMDSVPDDVEGWDSLAHVSIVVGIERAFKIRFTTQQIESLTSVGDLVRLAGGATAA